MLPNLDYRPRLSNLRPLLQPSDFVTEAGPKVTPAEVLADCVGYDPEFLDGFAVAWPAASEAIQGDLLEIPGTLHNRLDYTHFSVAMSARAGWQCS
jgi:endonuclease G